ncbi:MAG: ABC transporter substrate-binding protein [Spirochaetes bacterium]|nr:ABC transporter substrate-binding protein [Spirochaetota bacterium]
MDNSKKISRRQFIKRSLGISAASMLAGSQFLLQQQCSAITEELKIGYIRITDATPLLIAHALGYFKDEGLKVAKPVLLRGWSSLVEAFLSGKINLTHLLLPIPIWMRYSNNNPVKIIAWAHTNGSALSIAKDSAIKSFADLGGKQIAVPYWYSMHNVILQLACRKFHLKPVIKSNQEKIADDEVNLILLPPAEMPTALSSRKIDGFIVAEPFNALVEEKLDAKILRFTGDIWKNHPCCVVVVKEELIKQNPLMVQKATNAVVRAESWILKNPNETAKILSKDGMNYIPFSEKVIKRVFTGYEIERYGKQEPKAIQHPDWDVSRIGFQPYPYPSASRFIFNEMKKTVVAGNKNFLNKYQADFVAQDLIDTRFVVKALKDSGINNFPNLRYDPPWNREEVIEV